MHRKPGGSIPEHCWATETTKSRKIPKNGPSRGRSPQELRDRDFEKVAKKIIKTGPSLSCQEFYVLYESTGPISMIFGGFFGKKHLKI